VVVDFGKLASHATKTEGRPDLQPGVPSLTRESSRVKNLSRTAPGKTVFLRVDLGSASVGVVETVVRVGPSGDLGSHGRGGGFRIL